MVRTWAQACCCERILDQTFALCAEPRARPPTPARSLLGCSRIFSKFLLTVTMVNCCKRSVEEPQPFVDSKHRHCTDLTCCLAFLIFWLGMVIIAIVGLAYGRPESLVYGTDYQGSTCGSSGTAGSFIYYPKLTEDLAAAAASGQTDITSMSFFGVCMDTCPSMGDVVCTTDGAVALAEYVTRSGRSAPRLLARAWLTSMLTQLT